MVVARPYFSFRYRSDHWYDLPSALVEAKVPIDKQWDRCVKEKSVNELELPSALSITSHLGFHLSDQV